MMNLRRLATIVLATALPLLGLVAVEGPVQAHQASVPAPSAGALPSAVPSAITPNVDNGAVWSVAQVGNTLVMGGTFTSIGGVAHANIAAINATTGAVSTTFQASTNGQVFSVLPGPNDHTVYVGGSFTQVNGQPTQFLTLLDTGTGQIVSTFHTPAFDYGMIRDMAKVGNRLFIGGFFGHAGGVHPRRHRRRERHDRSRRQRVHERAVRGTPQRHRRQAPRAGSARGRWTSRPTAPA